MRRQLKYGYYSDSFDRFGDDLCQLIISYLPIRYKISFECVSKQWKGLIFNKQQNLSINTILIENILFNAIKIPKALQNDEQFLEVLFKKFKFIKEIEINFCINDNIIEALIKNCHFLERLILRGEIKENKLIEFIERCGDRLKFITKLVNEKEDKISLSCVSPNLKTILCEENTFFAENHFPKLEEISVTNVYFLNNFDSFADLYYKQIRKLRIILWIEALNLNLTAELTQISHFLKLEKLDLIINGFETNEKILGKELILIGKKCINLRSFRIESKYLFKLNVFEIFEEFQRIEKLYIVLKETNCANLGSVESLKNCKNLIHLELGISALKDKHLENIHSILPNLKSFKSIYSTPGITDKTLINLSKLKNIVLLKLFTGFYNPIVFTYLIESCPKLQSISTFLCRFSDELVEALIVKAFKNPKTYFKFNFIDSFNCQIYQKYTNDKTFPQNLAFNEYDYR